LEIVALQSTLTQPTRAPRDIDAAAVLDTYVQRLRALRDAASAEKQVAVGRLADAVQAGVAAYLDSQVKALEGPLRQIDTNASVRLREARPPSELARYWRRQIIAAAISMDFYANLAGGAWWVSLQMEALGERLRYLAFVQKVGHGETGVLALTVFAELVRPESDETRAAGEPEPLLELSPTDSVTFAYTDVFAARHAEVEDLLRRTLRSAVETFATRLG